MKRERVRTRMNGILKIKKTREDKGSLTPNPNPNL